MPRRRALALAAAVCLVAAAVRLPALGARNLGSALAGTVSAGLAALFAAEVAGPWAGAVAGLLVALSPIHVLASREAAPEPLALFLLLVSLVLLLRLEGGASLTTAAAHGVVLGGVATGPPGLIALALLQLVWLAWRRERRRVAAVSALAAGLVVAAVGASGLLRSPVADAPELARVPATTVAGVVRCAGASFTRVCGIEYHLVVSHARWVAPLTLGLVALMVLGARRSPPRARALLVAGAALPFLLGAGLAFLTGRVAPLQAHRLVVALPFVATLVAGGLASLAPRPSRLAAAAVLATVGTFLALALARPGASPGASYSIQPR